MVAKHNMPSPPRTQRGVVVVFATLAMAVLIGAGALALDVGNLVLSKSKLQNLADSAALGAARMIDLGGDHNDAITMGNQVIADNLSLDGFNSVSLDENNITFEFSDTLPFAASTNSDAPYVRVRIENVDIPDFLVKIFNIDLSVRASAVAGPSTSLTKACNITPLSICQGDLDPESEGVGKAGYKYNDLLVLKAASSTSSPIGSGNFMPIALAGSGASVYAEGLAGGYDYCMDLTENAPVTTKPGNMDGPSLGIDTRFGIYESIMNNPDNKAKYKEDFDSNYNGKDVEDFTDFVTVETILDDDGNTSGYAVTEGSYSGVHNHIAYQNSYSGDAYEECLVSSSCDKAFYRREIAVPVLKCNDPSITKAGGQMTVPFHSLACFYLVQPMSKTKHVDDTGGSNGDWLVGEFINDCPINSGTPGNEPNEEGPYKIVLYKDPDSEDS